MPYEEYSDRHEAHPGYAQTTDENGGCRPASRGGRVSPTVQTPRQSLRVLSDLEDMRRKRYTDKAGTFPYIIEASSSEAAYYINTLQAPGTIHKECCQDKVKVPSLENGMGETRSVLGDTTSTFFFTVGKANICDPATDMPDGVCKHPAKV